MTVSQQGVAPQSTIEPKPENPTPGKNIVFIDANIYLDCYQRRYDNYKKLLGNLNPIANLIFYTTTIDNEFRRNRASAYIKENKVEPGNVNILGFLPHLHAKVDSADLTAIKTEKEKLANQAKILRQKVAAFHLENVGAIAKGEDDVSKALAVIRSGIRQHTSEQLERARLRKELGNPPGKKSDPLGDQLSWEQLLEFVQEDDRLWIVSNDGDYLDRAEGETFLNPFLRDELCARNPKLVFRCFDNLADFFAEFQKTAAVPAAAKVADEQIKVAKAEFVANTTFANLSSDSSLSSTTLRVTPVCASSPNGQHEFPPDLVPKPSMYGGWSYWQFCRHCGAGFDTGEPYDD